MADETSYGWAGKILRVNLSTGSITTQPTDPYKEYIGGMGLANKIMFDEVPAGTDPFSPENKIVFAVGPLTASGVPLAGRTTICSLSTFSKDHLIVDAHCGGMLGAKIKLAGYDAIVVEGASSKPVYLNIKNDQVSIKDAAGVWGLGTRAATEALCRKESVQACVAAIGPSGENLTPYSCIINSRNHSAGAGTGAVMGSKMLKALVVEGDGSVNVKDPQTVADLSDYMLREIIGSNNNHVVPSTQQEWAEYYDKGSRWTARKGLFWEAAEGEPIETGEPKPGEINTVGYRCMKSTKDLGEAASKYTIKMNGCHSCPIHCYSDLRVEGTKETTGYETAGNTCAANFPVSVYMEPFLKMGLKDDGDLSILWDTTTSNTMDNLGLWCNYAQLYRDIAYCHANGVFKRVLPEAEYASIDWGKFDADRRDPTVMIEILTKIAQNDSEISYLAHGPLRVVRALGRAGVVRQREVHAGKLPRLARAPLHRVLRPGGRRVQHDVQPRRHDPLRRELPGLRPALRAEAADRRGGLGRRRRHRPGQELHAHERPQGELRLVEPRDRRAARLADAVQLGVAHDHEPHEGPQLPRRP